MCFDNLDKNILSDIQNILHQHNRYVTAFKTAVEILTENNASEMQLVLSASKRPHGTHELRFNLPFDSELGVLMPNDLMPNHHQRTLINDIDSAFYCFFSMLQLRSMLGLQSCSQG